MICSVGQYAFKSMGVYAVRLFPGQFSRCRRPPRAASHVHYSNDFVLMVDREEDAINMRPSPVAKYAYRVVRVEAFARNRTALRVLVQSQDRLLETVEPRRALLRRAIDQPQVQLFELCFCVSGDVNAVCHAYGASG